MHQNNLLPSDLRALLEDWLPDHSYSLHTLRTEYEELMEDTLENILQGLPWKHIVL